MLSLIIIFSSNTNNLFFLCLLKYILLIAALITIIYIKINCHYYNKNSYYKVDKIRHNYLKKIFYYYVQELPNYNHTYIHHRKIFWCWLQGEENAPKLYRACLDSLRKNIKNYEIIIITKENIKKYVKFPPYILEKYKNNQISNTHFSDLLRLELLIKYSGTWIDASVLLTKYDEVFFNGSLFFFQAFNNKNIAGSNWFITSEKNNPILKSTRDLLYEYYRTNNNLYNYFIFHFFF